jgi:polyhydroxybutyrate depolymerase
MPGHRALKIAAAIVAIAAVSVAVVAARRHVPIPLGPVASPAPAGDSTFSFQTGGVTRTYDLHVPAGVPGGSPVPLLIQLHGGGGDASGMERLTGFDSIADREGFVVASPNGIDKSWNDGRQEKADGVDDVAFISELIDRVEAQAPIDPARVYVTGMSNGAIMSGRLACELSDRIAAVAQVAGTASVETAAACRPGRPVPILEIHGTADPLVPYGGGTVVPQIGGGRGQVVGVDDWAAFWVANDSIAPDPTTTAIGSDTTVRTWRGSTPQSDVVFFRVDGAGHTWPGGRQYLPRFIIGSTTGSFDASETIWQFLSAHRLALGA